MSHYLPPGALTGALSIAAAVAAATGHTKIASWFADPATADALTVLAGGLGLAAGLLPGVTQPAAPPPAAKA
jgi:hypothetical protein